MVYKMKLLSNPHSTGRLMLAAKMNDFGKIKFCVFTNAPCLDSPSSGEFIRCTANDNI